jgi:hypothetical protein
MPAGRNLIASANRSSHAFVIDSWVGGVAQLAVASATVSAHRVKRRVREPLCVTGSRDEADMFVHGIPGRPA